MNIPNKVAAKHLAKVMNLAFTDHVIESEGERFEWGATIAKIVFHNPTAIALINERTGLNIEARERDFTLDSKNSSPAVARSVSECMASVRSASCDTSFVFAVTELCIAAGKESEGALALADDWVKYHALRF